jgi:hypothetical protein
MHRIEVNVQTGEEKIVELTPEEIEELEAQAAAAEAAAPPPPTPEEKLAALGLTVEDLKALLG